MELVLYGLKQSYLTLREACRLKVFENRILRRIFEPKRDENGQWRRMRMGSGEGSTMRNFIVCYCSSNIVKVIKSSRLRWAGHIARMEEGRSAYTILTGIPTGKERRLRVF